MGVIMLSLKNVSYKINNKIILNSVNLNIKKGEKVLIMGKSGSGKSTLFNLILNNISPNSGNIFYDKKDINKFSNKKLTEYRRNKVIVISQTDDLFENITVYQNLTMFYYAKDVIKILKKAGLVHLKDRLVFSLSGGERQRVAIIKACLSSCEMLLCDEITSALDNVNAKKIIDFVMQMFKNNTIIFISHDKTLFEGKIDHFIYIEDYKILIDTIINDIDNNNKKSKEKDRKSLYYISILQGLKKISISSFLMFLLTVICLYITLNFNDIFIYFAKDSYLKYLDYDVVLIKDNDNIDADYNTTFPSVEAYLQQCNLKINGINYNNVRFLPFYNKNNMSNIVVNSLFLQNQNIDEIISLSLNSALINYKCDKIDIFYENNMFSLPCIYYDIIYFSTNLLYVGTDEIYLIDYDFLLDDDRFTNNPMFFEKKEDKPYLESNAYNDYLTFLMIFTSIKSIVNYFFVIILLFSIFIMILVNISKMIKDIKVIAIYISRGYSNFEILLSYLISIFIYTCLLLVLIPFYKSIFKAIIITLLLQIITVIVSFKVFKHKKLSELLKEEALT